MILNQRPFQIEPFQIEPFQLCKTRTTLIPTCGVKTMLSYDKTLAQMSLNKPYVGPVVLEIVL